MKVCVRERRKNEIPFLSLLNIFKLQGIHWTAFQSFACEMLYKNTHEVDVTTAELQVRCMLSYKTHMKIMHSKQYKNKLFLQASIGFAILWSV
jgi:hypothetical protein